MVSAVLLQPVDLLKTRVQQSGHHSLVQAIHELRRNSNGIMAGLWRGTVPSAIRTGLGSALYFTSLNMIRQAAASPSAVARELGHSSSLPQRSNTVNMASGVIARSFAGLVLMPLTVIKVRYESSLYSYESILSAARHITKTGGVRGLFAGFGATTIRDAPNAGLYVLFYEMFKKKLSGLWQKRLADEPSGLRFTTINFTSGILAGTSCSIVSNPFDAVKTRIQLEPSTYHNMWQAARKLLAEEGSRAFWDGLALRMSRKALSSALAWTLYEELVHKASRAWREPSAGADPLSN